MMQEGNLCLLGRNVLTIEAKFRSGHPKSVTSQDLTGLHEGASNITKTAKQLQNKLYLPLSVFNGQLFLWSSPYLFYRKMGLKPPLTEFTSSVESLGLNTYVEDKSEWESCNKFR